MRREKILTGDFRHRADKSRARRTAASDGSTRRHQDHGTHVPHGRATVLVSVKKLQRRGRGAGIRLFRRRHARECEAQDDLTFVMNWLLNGETPLKRRLTVVDAASKRPRSVLADPQRARAEKWLLPRRRREKVATR